MTKNLHKFCAAALFFAAARHGQAAPDTGGAGTVSKPNLSTVVRASDVDAAAFAEWDNGQEKSISGDEGRTPTWLVWTENNARGFSGFWYGDSTNPGTRHLRVGFKTPLEVRTVLTRGGGQLSILKPDAPYPGNLNDDNQWIPAERLYKNGPSRAEATNNNYVLWTLPANTKTRAFRFSHTPKPTDNRYAGWLGGLLVMDERFVNLAPQAQAITSANNQFSSRINNGSDDGWAAWENLNRLDEKVKTAPVISTDSPEWVVLAWPSPVQLTGLEAIWAGFGSTEVQTYAGPADRHPREANEADWKTIGSYSGLRNGYPIQLWPNRLDFGSVITTRAIRLKLTSPTKVEHPHLDKATLGGKRVWLGELMALSPLGTEPIPAFATPKEDSNAPHPPIPVRFKLNKPGYVTLVIEDASGKRVRNLVSETPFPAGDNTAWWDGTDDLGRDIDAAKHGLYKIPAHFVEPGQYRTRGLVRDAIELHYEFSVYAEGKPPWTTVDTSGGWLTNHTPPQAALFVPAEKAPNGKPLVFLGSLVSEGGAGLAWVDLDGNKQGGRGWIGGNWTSAPYLAADSGPQALPGIYAYVGAVGESGKADKKAELRITGLTKSGDKAVLKYAFNSKSTYVAAEINGIAAYNGLLAVSLGKRGEITVVDAKAGSVVATAPITKPRGLAFDAQGRLLVISDKSLLRFDNVGNPAALPTPQTIISSGLEDPRGITLDSAGNIYISDRGTCHQVKIFDVAGKPLRTIGKAGTPKAGPYDPLRMNSPEGIAIDSQSQLWVTENDYLPKRVSVWTLDGKFIKAFYGPGKYGGGGTLDGFDKTRFYYADEARGVMEFKLDWQKGHSQLVNVLYRPGKDDLKLPEHSSAPETAFYRNEKRYFTNCYNANPTQGSSNAFLFGEQDGLIRPIAAAGRANDWDILKSEAFKPTWPAGVDLNGDLWKDKGKNQAFFIWSDLNNDGQVQPNEVLWQQGLTGGITVMPDLSFCVSRLDRKAVRFAPIDFTKEGAPRYDITKALVLADNVAGPASTGGDQVLAGDNGLTVTTLGIRPFNSLSISGANDGVATWSYPNVWPGLHASHEAAKPDRPGQVIGATRLLGGFVTPKGSDAGQVWGVNGNMGNMFLFTSDGLYVGTLFQDVRQGKLWRMPMAERNMTVDDITLHDENFWPTLTQTQDGNIYVQTGSDMALVRVDGLNSIRRLPETPLRISADDLKKAQDYLFEVEARRQQAQGSGVLEVAIKNNAPIVDGKIDDWTGARWVDIDKSGVGANFNSNSQPYDVSAAMAVSGDRLYMAWDTDAANLLQNSGEIANAPFKTGGALDLMLSTNPKADPKRNVPVEGDLRLTITQVKGKKFAVLYRAVVPGTKEPVAFSSPWRTITLDKVEDVSNEVELAGKGGKYEASIPLKVLGLQPQAGVAIQGDIGILRGDGAQTTARIYWSNKATGITADVPSEAQLTPNLWGTIQFKAVP